ncbi:MAG: DUF4097 family beta strand repeat-containing protein [Bryobacteraceae bacterium]
MNSLWTAGMAVVILGALASAVEPQTGLRCEERANRACEIRESRMPASGSLDVDAAPNGGIHVNAWDKNEIYVRAKVEAWGDSKEEARTRLGQVKVNVERGSVRATGPKQHEWGLFSNGQSWSVSYELYVPSKLDLTMKTVNGGIHVLGVRGSMKLETVNGGIDLTQVSGRVRGETVNGGVHVRLSGKKWEGDELNVQTVNGGVTVEIPDAYNASVKAQTVNGGMSSDFPGATITKTGPFGVGPKTLEQKLGEGGAPIKLETVNGGVKVQRRTA